MDSFKEREKGFESKLRMMRKRDSGSRPAPTG